MALLDRMAEFHERIVSVAASAERHLTGPSPSVEDLAVTRLQMARLITAYQLFVHREIFEPLITCGSASEARHARLIKAECIKLAEEFRAYTRHWTVEDVGARWAEYQPAALQFVGRIRKQVRNVSELGTSPHMLEISRSQIDAASAHG